MKLLVLGGTRFLGRHAVEAALSRGHEVTLFHRGRLARGLFPAAREVIGDRDGGLSALAGGRYDAVLDCCGYVPRVVRASAEALAAATERYLFVSSISVYADPIVAGYDERAPLRRLADPATEQVTGESYGGLKAACEDVVRERYGARGLIVRPGLIVGPHDPTDRFAHWVRRMAQDDAALAPGAPEQPVGWIDVRDLAEWMVALLEAGEPGLWHAAGPAAPCSMRAFLEGCAAALGKRARLEWVPEDFLLAHGVAPWSELPMWVPAADAGIHAPDLSRAKAAGLRLRPLTDTVRDTLAYERGLPSDARAGSAAMSRDRERELLAEWRARVTA